MRDIALVAVVALLLALILRNPFFGALGWTWLSYMNPQKLTYGFAYYQPFAQVVAIVWLASLLLSGRKRKFPLDAMISIWIVYLIWMTICTYYGLAGDYGWEYYSRVIKIQLMTFATMVCLLDLRHVRMVVWVVCVSIGYYTIKGGIFTVLTGGGHRVYGPAGTMFGENNLMAVATLMVVPLMLYLRSTVSHWALKLGLAAAACLSIVSALGSQSRGALIALVVFALYFWWSSRTKWLSGMLVVVLAFSLLNFMPDSWRDRMSTISDEAQSEENPRVLAWQYSLNVALARPTGGGFAAYSRNFYANYGVYVEKAFVAHSIYFQALAETGFPGLIMYLTIMFMTWRKLGQVIAQAQSDPDGGEFLALAKAIRLSFIAYFSGGAFLSLAFFDLPWLFVGVAHMLRFFQTSGQGEKDWAGSISGVKKRGKPLAGA